MADPVLEGDVPSNNTIQNLASIASENSKNEASPSPLQSSWLKWSVPPSAGSLTLFPKGLTVQRETLQQNVAAYKSKHKNDAFVESGSTTELNSVSLRLVDTEEKDEDTDKGGNTKRDSGEVPKTMQKQMVTEVSNLEDKRTLDIGDAMLRNDISKLMPVRLFNFQSREISNERQNSCLAINQSGEPSANISTSSPRSEKYAFSPYRNSKFEIFVGGKTQNNNTGCASFVPMANSLSAFRTQPISTRKPPLPPGALTHLKGGLAAQGNKGHVQSMPQDSGKRLRVSEITNKKFIPVADSNIEGCVERGNSHPSYSRTDVIGSSGGLTAKAVMFDKVASAANNPLMNLVTMSDNIQAAFPGSSGQGRLSHQQDVLAFSNDNMKKTLGSQGENESDSENVLNLDNERKPFQRPQYCVTGKANFQSLFEKEGKGIQEFSVSESLCGNVGDALQVTKGSLQNRSGLLSTTSAPSLATSLDDLVPGNISKSANQNLIHFKSLKADIFWGDRESSSPVSSANEKSKLKVSMRQGSSPPTHSLQNNVEMQSQASRASSTACYSCEAIVKSYYNSEPEHCEQIEGGQMTSMRIDHGSCKRTDVKAPAIISQAERAPSMFAIKQARHNFHESAEEYRSGSRSCGIDVEVGKVDVEKTQQSDQIKDGVCKLGSRNEGTVLGAGLEVMRIWHGRDLGNSRTENIPSEKIISSPHSAQPSILQHQMDVDLCSSPERHSKRLKCTLHSDEKMLESSCSEMVANTRGQKMQILDQYGGFKGRKDTEAVRLLYRDEIRRASKEYNKLSTCEKDAPEQHCELLVPKRGDAMASCLGKRPCPIDHQTSSTFLDHTALNHTSVGQNTMGPTPHSSKCIALQTKVSSSGNGNSSRLQKKIDMASILSHPWIQHWRPSYQIASPLCEMCCGSLVNKEINRKSPPHLFAPMKTMPSAAAMAIVGIASRQIRPCQLQKKGSFSVWNVVGCTVNRTID